MYFVFDTQRQSKAFVGYFAQVSNMAPGSLYISYYQKIIVFQFIYLYITGMGVDRHIRVTLKLPNRKIYI